MIRLTFTENQGTGCVRVFIDNNVHYGYWLDEKYLSIILDEEQYKAYCDLAPLDNTQIFMVEDNKKNIISKHGYTYHGC